MTEIRLRHGLDLRPFAEAYARHGWVQVPNVLEPEAAQALAQALLKATPWGLSLPGEAGSGQWIAPGEIEKLGREGMTRLVSDALTRARSGFSFSYLAYPIIEALLAGREPDHPTHRLVELMNGREWLDFAEALTGETLTKIDAQATLYRPGDFLTLHDDTGVGERRAAYTLGLTKDWRPDWGGQLLFHDPEGEIIRGLTPRFNMLTVFRTPQWHSVAPVAPYAGEPRLSITGWMRDDPPVA